MTAFSSTSGKALLRYAFFALVILGLFWQTARQLADTVWSVETFSHGILIPPICAWLIWRNRQTIFNAPIQGSWFACAGVFAFGAMWFAGKLVDFRILQNFGLIGMLVCGWAVVNGITVFRKSMFPALFLFFVVPFGTFLDYPLMHITADITVRTIAMFGIPVYQDGLQFKLPTGNWSVIEACSGLRYLLASIILGCLFAYLNFSTIKRRIAFVLLCIVVSLIANWVRAVTVVLVGHLSNMRLGTGDDHVWYGWVFFGIVMYAVFYLANKFSDIPQGAHLAVKDNTPVAVNSESGAAKRLWMPLLLAIGMVVFFRTAVTAAVDTNVRSDFFSSMALPAQFKIASQLSYEPHYTNGIATLKANTSANLEQELFLSYYADQTNRGKMISGENGLVDTNSAWKVIEFDKPTPGNDGIYEAIIQRGNERRLVLYWFQIGPTTVANKYQAARAQLTRALRFEPDQAVYVSVSATLDGEPAKVRAALTESTQTIRQTVIRHLENKPN
jgi:exosortase A